MHFANITNYILTQVYIKFPLSHIVSVNCLLLASSSHAQAEMSSQCSCCSCQSHEHYSVYEKNLTLLLTLNLTGLIPRQINMPKLEHNSKGHPHKTPVNNTILSILCY